MTQGIFREIFPKKIFFCIVTSLRTIIERDHVASTSDGLVHLDMISRQTSYLPWYWNLSSKLTRSKNPGNDSGDFPENFSKKNILLYCDVTTDDYWKGSRGINKWRAGAPRHDITANLISSLILKFEFKADSIDFNSENSQEFDSTKIKYRIRSN